jgi:hypothetical protein
MKISSQNNLSQVMRQVFVDRIVEDGKEESRRTSVSATNLYPILGSASAMVENLSKLGTADNSLLKEIICTWI